jgi:predicted amidohydrolase YtcJ
VLNVLEDVNRDVPLKNLRWGLVTAKPVAEDAGTSPPWAAASTSEPDVARRRAFLQKYGAQLAADAPPIKRIREMGIPLACGTDANRATSYNPWIGVHWLLTGKTLGGAKLQGDQNLLDRTEALRLYTAGGAWMSSEEDKTGTLWGVLTRRVPGAVRRAMPLDAVAT